MQNEDFIQRKKDLYCAFINFIDATDNSKGNFEVLINIFEKQKIFQNRDEIRTILHLLTLIADNHHRTSDFFTKLEQILQYIIKNSVIPISEFIQYFNNYNRRLLLFLYKNEFIQPDKFVINDFIKKYKFIITKHYKPKEFYYVHQYYYYIYPGIKKYIPEEKQKIIEEDILDEFELNIEEFEQKCQVGENDSYICSLIRQDSVEEFIIYVNKNSIPLMSELKLSIFETNSFLLDHRPTLIEYATFYGSIQIIQYLKYNNVPLDPSLWLYAIHSNNPEIIQFCEENLIIEDKKFVVKILQESIKCHHNDIANYINDNFISQEKEQENDSLIINCCNFMLYPNKIDSFISKNRNENGFNLSILCISLKQITIPSSLESIGESAFFNCYSLEEVIMHSLIKSIGKNAFGNCSSLKHFEMPNIAEINEYTFYNCSSLTEIIIPSSVTTIGDYSFSGCSSLKDILIPSSVQKIGKFAFRICLSLTQIIIPTSVAIIEEGAFSWCSSLKQVELPSSLKSIENYLFNGCSSLEKIEIPSSVTSFGKFSFCGCSSLEKIKIPPSVTSIGEFSFYGCLSLKTLPEQFIALNEISSLNASDYKIVHEFSSCYGSTFEGIVKKTKEKVVIKLYHKSFFKDSSEFKEMVDCTCLNIPGFVKIQNYEVNNFVIIKNEILYNSDCYNFSYITIRDYVKYGDISQMTKDYLNSRGNKNDIMNPTIRSKIIFGVAVIMKQLHSKNIIHRNLKMSKVLLNDHFEPMISPSRYTKIVTKTNELETIIFTLYNMAPEMQKCYNDDYCFSVDVCSYAFFLYEMFSHEIVMRDKKYDEIKFRNAMLRGERPLKADFIPNNYWELIQLCWFQDPDERPTFENIVEILNDDKYALEEFGMKTDLNELHEYRKRMSF